MTQPQYLRGYVRTKLVNVLKGLPRWHDVIIRGSSPGEIRSADQLLDWLARYGVVVAKIVEERDQALRDVRAAREALRLEREEGQKLPGPIPAGTLVWCGTFDHPPRPHGYEEACESPMRVYAVSVIPETPPPPPPRYDPLPNPVVPDDGRDVRERAAGPDA